MSSPRLDLDWDQHARFPHTWIAPLPDGTEVSIFIQAAQGRGYGNNVFIEHLVHDKQDHRAFATAHRVLRAKGMRLSEVKQAAEEWAAETYPLAMLGQIKTNPKEVQLLRWETLGHPMRSRTLSWQTQRLPDNTYFFIDEVETSAGWLIVLFRAPFSATKFGQCARIAVGGRHEKDSLKGVAERISQHDFPLLTLSQLGRKNPNDTKLIAKLQKVEALRRGATTTGERRAAEQAYERLVQQLEKSRELELQKPKPPIRQPPKQPSRKEVQATRSVMEKALRAVYGPSWSRLDGDARAAAVDEAYVRWLEAGAHAQVDIHQIALDVRRAQRASREKEMQFGEYASDEAGSFVDPEDAHEAAERVSRGDTVWSLLEDFSRRSEVSKMQATLVELHLGKSVFPGQPRRLKGSMPSRDLAETHPGGGERCPTCRAIARYVRVAGLTPDAVGQTVDSVLVDLRQQLD